jgi:2'-5' RNA ligase
LADCIELRDVDDRAPGAVFFAMQPDANAAVAATGVLNQLRETERLAGRLRGPDLLHVTLVRLGGLPELDPAILAPASGAGHAIMRRPFRIVFDRAATFRVRRGRQPPLVLMTQQPAWEANALRLALMEELALRGVPFDRASSFTPHMTLHYQAKCVPPRPVPPISWTANEFVLIRSRHGESRHLVLGRWRLPGAG